MDINFISNILSFTDYIICRIQCEDTQCVLHTRNTFRSKLLFVVFLVMYFIKLFNFLIVRLIKKFCSSKTVWKKMYEDWSTIWLMILSLLINKLDFILSFNGTLFGLYLQTLLIDNSCRTDDLDLLNHRPIGLNLHNFFFKPIECSCCRYNTPGNIYTTNMILYVELLGGWKLLPFTFPLTLSESIFPGYTLEKGTIQEALIICPRPLTLLHKMFPRSYVLLLYRMFYICWIIE